MEPVGINKDGRIVTPPQNHGISAGAFKSVTIPMTVNGNRTVKQWQACIVGVGGNDLACQTVEAP